MPDILYPVKWVVELLLVAFHNLFTFLGLRSGDGLTWVLAITGLVLVVRAALIPLFVRQIKSQRGMVLLQPELQKLQKKYKGKTDRESREAFAKEQMALYKNTGSNPLSSCLPLLAQMPIFMSLFFVLNEAQHGAAQLVLQSLANLLDVVASDQRGGQEHPRLVAEAQGAQGDLLAERVDLLHKVEARAPHDAERGLPPLQHGAALVEDDDDQDALVGLLGHPQDGVGGVALARVRGHSRVHRPEFDGGGGHAFLLISHGNKCFIASC